MKSKAILAAAWGLTAATSAATAADIPGVSRPYAAPVAYAYSWMGPYVGANVGYSWGAITNNSAEPSGAELGAQLGYNWQTGSLVIGGETDLQFSDADDVLAPWKFSNPWFGTARGRLGFAANNILVYGTAGLAYGGINVESGGLSESKTHFGWALGAGMEVGLTQNWSAKAEYIYFDLADRTRLIGTSNGFESNLLRLGVNYRF